MTCIEKPNRETPIPQRKNRKLAAVEPQEKEIRKQAKFRNEHPKDVNRFW